MSNLSETIDVILEDASLDSSDTVSSANELAKQLEIVQQQVYELQNRLTIFQRRLCGELALNLRRRMPSFNIAISNNGCKVGYKSQFLLLQPNIRRGVWDIKPNSRFTRKFLNRHSSKTVISSSLDTLVNVIVQYFTEHFKTLGEDIIGNGLVMLEEKRVTIVDLMQWYKQQEYSKKLNSRMSRNDRH